MNVGQNNIEKVIKCVVKVFNPLYPIDEMKLPSRALMSTLSVEAKCIANLQAAKAVADNVNSTIHYDETSKFGNKTLGIQVTIGGVQYALGLVDQSQGTAESLFNSIKTCINTSATNLEKISGNNSLVKLLFNIKNTMTDRHSVNFNVDGLLEDWRSQVAESEFEHLSKEEALQMSSLNKLRCNLHFLVGLVDAAEKGLKKFEEVVRNVPVTSNFRMFGSDSGALRTIRTTCKAFSQRGGCEKSGVMAPYAVYIKDSEKQAVLSKFKGNRFNIVFHNSAVIIYQMEHMLNFLEIYGADNRLLKAVEEDLKDPINIAGICALGIIDKLITGPYWRLCESVDNILDLNKDINSLFTNCIAWSKCTDKFITTETPGFPTAVVEKDLIYQALFRKDFTENPLVHIAMQIIMGEFTLTLANQMKEVLPGGVFDNPSDVLREQVQGTSTTNALSERCFGMSDTLMRAQPNATTLNIESTVLFKQKNKHDWISNMSNEDLQLYTEFARKSANQAKADYKDRLLEIKKDMQAKIVNRQMAEQQKVLKKAEIKSKIVDEIAKIGGEWKTCEQAQIEYDKLVFI